MFFVTIKNAIQLIVYTCFCLVVLVSPGDILTAVESGVDVFDSACVLTATESGCAFTFHNSRTSSSDCADERENRATENIATEPPSHQIDLNDEK